VPVAVHPEAKAQQLELGELLLDRYYDPSTDQFLSVDPDVGETGQPYAFTNDDPVNESDPLGNHGGCTTSYCGPNSGTIVTSTGEYCSTNCGGSPTTTNLGDGATAALPAPSSSLTFLTFLSTQPSSVVDYFECQNGDQSACKAIAPVPPSPSVSSVQQMLNICNYSGPLSTPSTTRRDAARNVGNSDRRPLPV
jgi:hypothetical protein